MDDFPSTLAQTKPTLIRQNQRFTRTQIDYIITHRAGIDSDFI